MPGQEINYKISLDNITIVGVPKFKASYVRNMLVSKGIINNYWMTANKRYHHNFTIIGGGMIQITHDTGFYDSDKMTVHQIRLEFNPNKVGLYPKLVPEYLDLLKLIQDPKITRKDIAVDLYGIDINDYSVMDYAGRKRIEYKTGSMKLETLYFGSSTSDERIRIYNKALEQNLQGIELEGEKLNWWRIEAQLRKDKAEKMKYNPFGKIKVVSKSDFLHHDIRTRAMLYYLQANPDAMKELSVNVRGKYKKLLGEQIEYWYIDLEGIMNENVEELHLQLVGWLNFCPIDVKEGFTVTELISCLNLPEDKFTEDQRKELEKKLEDWKEINLENVSRGTKEDFETWIKNELEGEEEE